MGPQPYRPEWMKPDEAALLVLVSECGMHARPRGLMADELAEIIGMHWKRCYYLLEKWNRRGWFSSGVSARTGWLEDEGKHVAHQTLAMIGHGFPAPGDWMRECREIVKRALEAMETEPQEDIP